MSSVIGRISGGGKLLARLGEIQNVVFPVIATEVELGAMAIHGEAVKSIQAKGSVDHIETRYNPKREQEVSSPGEAPNTDRGTLVQSIKFEIDPGSLSAVVGTNLKYGKFLELGTQKLAARPWLFPAFEKFREPIKKNIADAIKQALKEAKA